MSLRSRKQHTLLQKVECEGIGLHSGNVVRMTVRPASENRGILFKRLDIKGDSADISYIPAVYDAVTETNLGTVIENRYGVKVRTIEHLMAALWGMGIDNAVVELDADEVPIMDGSSEVFTSLIKKAGILRQSANRRVIKIDAPIKVCDGDSFITVEPYDGFAIEGEIDFSNDAIGRQRACFDFNCDSFDTGLSYARTFGFVEDIEYLRSIGLTRGGSLENAIVIDENGVLNEDGLRSDKEFVHHKILDCLGDFFLAGMRIEGKITAYKSGHAINNKFIRELFARGESWHVEYAGDGELLYSNDNDIASDMDDIAIAVYSRPPVANKILASSSL